jgi:hypothetical protein
MPPPSTPPIMRRPNSILHQEATSICGRGFPLTSLFRTLKRAPGVARRDASNVFRGSQPRPMATAATTRAIVDHVVTATGSSKHQAWTPLDHIERLLKEAC